MSGISDILQPLFDSPIWHSEHPAREAVTQLYVVGIQKMIDEKPLVQRYDDHNLITWKEGQAKKMQNYIASLIYTAGKPKEKVPSKEFSLSEVQLDLKPVMVPLAFKTIVPFLGVYTFLMFYLGRKTRRK